MNPRFGENPRQRELGWLHATGDRQLLDQISECDILRLAVAERGILVRIRPDRLGRPGAPSAAGEQPSREGTVGEDPDSFAPAERQELPLVLSPKQVVVVGYGHEVRTAAAFRLGNALHEGPDRHDRDAGI